MNLAKSFQQFNNDNTVFCEPIKNNIMADGNFVRILYSTKVMTLNGIYLLVNFNDMSCEKYYNKYKCSFNVNNHRELIESIRLLEEMLLIKYKSNKIPSTKIYDQIKYGYIKTFNDIGNNPHTTFILKISGIWETPTHYGITYKFIKVN